MSNTYFEITKTDDKISPGRSIDMKLSLTAFMGGDRNIQLTLTSNGNPFHDKEETTYYTLTNKEQDMLIAAIMERRVGKVSATNEVKSEYSPPES
jgi:hypothetical protein